MRHPVCFKGYYWLILGSIFICNGLNGLVFAEETTSKIPGVYSNYPSDGERDLSYKLGKTHHIPMDVLVLNLLEALDQITKYRIPDAPPAIQKVTHSVVEQYACQKPCAALAVYRAGEGVYLDESLKPETNVFARSVLLHEIVHYVQDMNDELVNLKECERWYRREQEAYAVQKRFLEIVGSQIRVAYSQGQACDSDLD
tara:strand:- start:105 stop:701 length:597 start_codon:yes stop_codon:yes gene_type:complete